uniref:Beta-microseminoprotein n=1 Tax=Salarias fasciatus TaxID=181472 RepID=A0A672H5E5_SALFA
KKLLTVTILLSALLALSHAVCYRKPMTPSMEGMTHCQDDVDKTWHPVGSKWRNSQCDDCDCGGCCSTVATPVEFPAECVSVFNQEKCKYDVHRRDDPSVTCPIFASVLINMK